jgi:hypothetical protein
MTLKITPELLRQQKAAIENDMQEAEPAMV